MEWWRALFSSPPWQGLHERLTPSQWVGVVTAFVGVALIAVG